MTINDLEVAVQAALEAMRNAQLSAEISPAKELLLPDGLTPVIELIQEDGRRKRGNAAAWNWNPQSDRIRISFRPTPVTPVARPFSEQNEPMSPSPAPTSIPAPVTSEQPSKELNVDAITPQEIVECCQALAVAEKSNRQFIALKWFRDSYLATLDFSWARSPRRRQRVLSEAIDLGRIDAKKIPNPKSEFPTMTISLNRSMPIPGVAPRFQPVAVRGPAVSETLLRDRGSL